ncbi:hypothetical protein [Kitasatospora sp. McL0602]|uniref:hypothetical protein n=1 Tax=Kitasatospora sp. McL0602 TaxID=3439530 RepID=UPI003F8900A9
MRLLYLFHVSNSSRLTADSGFTFADLLAPALADAGVEVTMAAPIPAGGERVRFAPTISPSTKYRARFDPDMDALVALIRDRRPEVVVANQIEAARRSGPLFWKPGWTRGSWVTATTCRSPSRAPVRWNSTRRWTTAGSAAACCWPSPPASRPATASWSTPPPPPR